MPLIKFVDMFSGIGGFREGLTRAGGFECVGHCEIDKYANRSYNALFDTKGEWFIEDARKADPSAMPDFQLLCGGFPCQTFSIAGSRKGFGDPRGTLFFELARLAEARKPPYLLFENVVGLIYDNFRELLFACNIPHTGNGPRVHDFRHTFAVHTLEKQLSDGYDPMVIVPRLAAYLGHKSYRETCWYIHLTVASFPELSQKLDRAFVGIIPVGGETDEEN